MSHLGIKLTPYGQIPGAPPFEVGYSYGGDGTFLCPDDPFQNTRGEPGFYHDTQLGRAGVGKPGFFARMRQRRIAKKLGLGRSIPTDFDLAPTYGWVPFSDGFVAAKEGFQPGTWIPPNGYDPAGAYGPQMVPRDRPWTYNADPSTMAMPGFRDVSPTDAAVNSDPTLVTLMTSLQDQQSRSNKLFWLSILSTSAIVISSIVTTIRNAKLIKQERRLLDEEEAILASQAAG